jgi:60 kDa SS-A/Ro ribonucleoprotein
MARLNKTALKKVPIYTHGGGRAVRIGAEKELRRSVMSCMLWEDEHYESGEAISSHIAELVSEVKPELVKDIAIEARTRMNLRHAPLYLAKLMVQYPEHRKLVATTLSEVIQRADELNEFLAMYWKDGKCPLAAQVKRGLAQAFTKFDAYQLAKYKSEGDSFSLRDVLFLVHAKPENGVKGYTKDARRQGVCPPQDTGSQLFSQLVDGSLPIPKTWESELSAGKDKKKTFEDLILGRKLPAMALLRNLRNMSQSGVDIKLVAKALQTSNFSRVLPFRFLEAAKYVPEWEYLVEEAFLKRVSTLPKLKGKTVWIVDVSGSMYHATLSKKSEVDRARAACSLAVLGREQCELVSVYATAGNDTREIHSTQIVPARRGFALSDDIYKLTGPLGGGGIFLTQVMDYVKERERTADRVIVITDEQDCDKHLTRSANKADAFGTNNYLINVASAQNGIGYGKWTHVDGFSESVLDYIRYSENEIEAGGN